MRPIRRPVPPVHTAVFRTTNAFHHADTRNKVWHDVAANFGSGVRQLPHACIISRQLEPDANSRNQKKNKSHTNKTWSTSRFILPLPSVRGDDWFRPEVLLLR